MDQFTMDTPSGLVVRFDVFKTSIEVNIRSNAYDCVYREFTGNKACKYFFVFKELTREGFTVYFPGHSIPVAEKVALLLNLGAEGEHPRDAAIEDYLRDIVKMAETDTAILESEMYDSKAKEEDEEEEEEEEEEKEEETSDAGPRCSIL